MLKTIHQTRNLTRAAEYLHVTQSALSQQLKDIESRLGADLFSRTGKQMVLTPVGKTLLTRAELILDQIEQAELDIDRAVNGESGELRIGVRCLFCYYWLPRVLKRFRDVYPGVDIEIGNSTDPEADLIAEKIDIAISAADRFDPRIDAAPLFSDQVMVVMSEDDPLSARPVIELKDFHGTDIISLIERSKHYFFYALLEHRNIRPRRYMTISHPEAMVDLIEAGLGVGILPQWYVATYKRRKRLATVPLTARGTTLHWKASFLKTRQAPAYQREFIRLISAEAVL